MDKRKPNLLVIGAQKAATTWLRDALMQHPDVFMADGEPQFFNRDAMGFAQYLDLFAAAGDCHVIGEKTPDYLHMSTSRIKRVKRLLGPVKLLVVLRRPEYRSWSQARMEESSFNRSCLDSAALTRLARNVVSYRNRDRSSYARHLSRWIRVFGDEALMVCFFTEVVERPVDLMKRIFQWLEIDPSVRTTIPPPVWASQFADLPDEVLGYLSSVYRDEANRLRDLGLNPPNHWDTALADTVKGVPLMRHRLEMFVPNALYRIFDSLRGRIPGSYTTFANRWFHRYLANERRTGQHTKRF